MTQEERIHQLECQVDELNKKLTQESIKRQRYSLGFTA